MTIDTSSLADAARSLGGLPTTEEEVWRYSRIDELDLDDFALGAPGAATAAPAPPLVLAGLEARAATVTIVDGVPVELDVAAGAPVTVTIEEATEPLGEPVDVFHRLNDELARHRVVVSVADGKVVEHPIVVVHHTSTPGIATLPRTVVRVGASAQAQVVEVHTSPEGVHALTLPVVELQVGRAGRLGHLVVQDLGLATWQVGSLVARVEAEADLVAGTAGFGGDYARQRTDCKLVGRGASGELLAVYFGEATQTLDFRTFQDHAAPDTTSNLLFKGAVGGTSRSVYTGLIRVRKDARGTNAFQTNRNIKLGDGAWAESVPNLEIENNDVRCSHASAVGPVDEDQRFYLESRGVPTAVAERLVVTGFFDEVLARLPVPAMAVGLRALVGAKLDRKDQP